MDAAWSPKCCFPTTDLYCAMTLYFSAVKTSNYAWRPLWVGKNALDTSP